jgi:[ribosomal protein S5]-alanine N-acetyltransferase
MEHGAVVPLVTARLIMRDFYEADAEAVHALRSDPAVARFMSFHAETPEQARAWLSGVIFHNRKVPRAAYNLAITRRADDRLIGWIGIGRSSRSSDAGELGVGYMLRSDAWGQGYATEAVRAVIALGFRALGGRRVSAWCWVENGASARVMVKAGMRLARRYQETEPKSGRPTECVEYAVRIEEWRQGQEPPRAGPTGSAPARR